MPRIRRPKSSASVTRSTTARSRLGSRSNLVPEPFLAAARDPSNWRLIAHNFEFERAMLEHVLVPKHGFPSIPLEVQHCSMAVALANGYPAELETLAKALELPYQKDREGLLLMRQMSSATQAAQRRRQDSSTLDI